jgi:hypothetical protein
MHEDIGSIEKNIQEFIKYFQNIDANAFLRLRFHQKASIMDSIINRSELEELGFQSDLDQDRKFFLEGYRFGVSSTIDFYDKNTQTLIDFRIGLKSECKEEWIIQNIINSLISQENKFSVIKQVVIYNVLKGQMYTFQNLHKYSLNTVIEPLLIKYDFHEKLIQRLLKNKSKKE